MLVMAICCSLDNEELRSAVDVINFVMTMRAVLSANRMFGSIT
jgi:hypothetical protein